MSTVASPSLSAEIRQLLDQVRGRVRSYVWIDGLARITVCLGAAFWLSLGFDWWVEPPVAVRVLMVAGTLVGLGWIIYRYLFRRAFVPLSDASLALVVERRYLHFGDSLLTTVELGEQTEHARDFNPEMLQYTQRMAEAGTSQAVPSELLRWGRLAGWVAGAFALVLSIAALLVWAPGVLNIWRDRMLGSNVAWPRNTLLEAEGFGNGPVKIGRGGEYTLVVKAETPWEKPDRVVPAQVQVRYTMQDGNHGKPNMTREREAIPPQDHYQHFRYQFQGVNSPIKFYAVGGDGRTQDHEIEVVENPTISGMQLDCAYPDYFQRAAALNVPVAPRSQWPQGARITLRATVNKELEKVQIDRLEGLKIVPYTELQFQSDKAGSNATVVTHAGSSDSTKQADRKSFTLVIDRLDEDLALQFNLLDTDGIKTRVPYRVTLVVVPDEPPEVKMRLRSIGTSITPDARLPVIGAISDKVGVAKAWFDYQAALPDAARDPTKKAAEPAAVRQPFLAKVNNQQELEFLQPKRDGGDSAPEAAAQEEALDIKDLNLPVGAKLSVIIKAADHCNLRPEPNIGSGERYLMDLVTPQQLRSILEGREAQQRRRFETIISEMADTRDSLGRIKFQPVQPPGDGKKKGDEPEDALKVKPGAEPDDRNAAPPSPENIRLLRVQRGIANCQRSAEENRLLALDFDDLREEMINNRIDTEELRNRLGEKIIRPLEQLAKKSLPEFERRLQRLGQNNTNPEQGLAALEVAKEQGDKVLREMDQILKNMLELEDYNQLVETLRQIVELQERLNSQTLLQQKERARKLLNGGD